MTDTPKKGPKAAPEGETKEAKFARLATLRTNKALAAIGNLRGLANKTNYTYTDTQWEQIFGALNAEMQKIADALKAGAPVVEGGFSLVDPETPDAPAT